METAVFNKLINDYIFWLKTLNYSISTSESSPKRVKDFLLWLEANKVFNLFTVTDEQIQAFFKYLETRSNKRKSGGLSDNYIYSYYTAIRRFSRFLSQTKEIALKVELNFNLKQTNKIILKQDEIKALFDATSNDVLGLRDKAMLTVYYSCGLRKSEGIALNIYDVDTNKQRLFVSKGKNYKERFVPFNSYSANVFNEYLHYSRPYLEIDKNEAFLLSLKGNRIHGNALINRLKCLTGSLGLNKEIGLHTLRHSIATHLLQNGLDLNKVKIFLGHKSLESTQIYTHVANETF